MALFYRVFCLQPVPEIPLLEAFKWKKRMKNCFSFSKIPLVFKNTKAINPLSFETVSPGAVSDILMSLSSTPNYSPRHELSICNAFGAGLGDDVTQTMCCLWQNDGNSPKRRLPVDGLSTKYILGLMALGICFLTVSLVNPGFFLHLPYPMDYESV